MKKLVSFLLAAVIILTCLPVNVLGASAARDTAYEEELAYDLKALGLFKGVSETDFALNRAPTRGEAVVMLIRLLGRENQALKETWSHPFKDVPAWADKYIGYAYNNGLTNGISDTQFGFENKATANMYLTFVLRALGYTDADNGDFSWSNPYALAGTTGILPQRVNTENFWRADVVLISYAALEARLKGSDRTLADKLVSEGVFTYDAYFLFYDASGHGAGTAAPGTQGTLPSTEIYSKCAPAVFYIEVSDARGEPYATGSGFFIAEDGLAVTNYHVLEGCSSAKITTADKKTYNVLGVYNYSIKDDWAVIKVDGTGFTYLTIGDTTLTGGEKIYAIGSPLALQNTISDGIVSNPARQIGDNTYIQITAPISSGSSGGALLNTRGEVIGITSAGIEQGQNLNFAISMSYVNTAKTSYIPISRFVEVTAKADPVRYLKYYLTINGYFDNTYGCYSYYIVISEDIFMACYYPVSDLVTFESMVNFDNREYYLMLDVEPTKESGSQHAFYFTQELDKYSSIEVEGEINAALYNAAYRPDMAYYYGPESMKTQMKEMVTIAIMDLLFTMQSFFYAEQLPVTIADYGFIQAFKDFK